MGWLIGERSKKDVIKHLNEDLGTNNKLVKSCVRGDTLWQVIETPETRFIACNLLGTIDGEWGYKDMCESMHPYRYHCPLSYLELAPVASEEWREGVRQYHAEQSGKSKKWRLTVGNSSRDYTWDKKYTYEVVRAYFEKCMGETEFKLEVVR